MTRPTLLLDESNDLGALVTLIELKEAIAGMKWGKSVGQDDMPPGLYSIFGIC